MIHAGIDLVKMDRINNIKKLEKIYTPAELEYLKAHNYNTETKAGIYAAKEALLKSIRVALNIYSLLEIEILHDERNAPYLNFYGKLKEIVQKEDLSFSLSISHDGEYATAIVICYQLLH